MKLGKVKFVNSVRGFGFVQSEDVDFYFHISKLINTTINIGDYVIFNIQKSIRVKGKFEITTIESLNFENALNSINALNKYERLSVYRFFPNLIDILVSKSIADLKDNIENKAHNILTGFNIIDFSETIDAKISTYAKKKPGDDDSFTARIVSKFPDTNDEYLKGLDTNFTQNTYSDWGFSCCYQMERDYNKIQRGIDEKQLPLIQSELRENFLLSYNPKDHLNSLIRQFSELYIIEIRQSISQGDNVSELGISQLTLDSYRNYYEAFTILVLFSIISTTTTYLSVLLS
jgi:cold shock CspA family protein